MKGRSARNFGSALVVMLITGCAASPPPELRVTTGLEISPPQKVAAVEPAAKPTPPARKAAPPPAPETPNIPSAAVDPAAATTATAPSASAVTADQGIEGLVGLDESEVQSVLGAPMLQEDRAPTKLWVFRNHSCTLNITLYPDVKTRQFHALSYEVISDVHTPERTRQCVAELAVQFPKR
jgi:hypothetical protein